MTDRFFFLLFFVCLFFAGENPLLKNSYPQTVRGCVGFHCESQVHLRGFRCYHPRYRSYIKFVGEGDASLQTDACGEATDSSHACVSGTLNWRQVTKGRSVFLCGCFTSLYLHSPSQMAKLLRLRCGFRLVKSKPLYLWLFLSFNDINLWTYCSCGVILEFVFIHLLCADFGNSNYFTAPKCLYAPDACVCANTVNHPRKTHCETNTVDIKR